MGYIRNSEILKKVGAKIREARLNKGYAQQELADLCDLELSQINRIELGKINTSVSVLFIIGEVLEVSPSVFLEIKS